MDKNLKKVGKLTKRNGEIAFEFDQNAPLAPFLEPLQGGVFTLGTLKQKLRQVNHSEFHDTNAWSLRLLGVQGSQTIYYNEGLHDETVPILTSDGEISVTLSADDGLVICRL